MTAECLHGHQQQISGERCWRSSSVGRVSGPQRLVAQCAGSLYWFVFFLIFIYLTVLGLSCSTWNLVL